ncbi:MULTISPECIES: hypothetical protein [Xenorhabdus]|uniref:Uncharacterized protein n=1 Tax=Xenorhabdus stockiae TaxID=351614 RepID=A0A2D0KNP0_9GAMM|nr:MULTISPECIES: hypothetical protein [Xenorhabdus]PHM55900.1 hypothetical protein Xekk_01980 [Xenorhabdus sp. KK7.4]PHM59599.1 hypothetical protein Xekk_00011 [Xenorhabdus sp. KK7.4]PHM65049.1 hypothetical protein Xsto_02361 [Xenorhabdus stockiae]
MTHDEFLDDMKENFISLFDEKSTEPVDYDNLFIDYKESLEQNFERYLQLFKSQVVILSQARKKGDELAMQSALLILRTHAMSLTSFFDAIVEDAESLLRTGEWSKIPEGYKLPECYNKE